MLSQKTLVQNNQQAQSKWRSRHFRQWELTNGEIPLCSSPFRKPRPPPPGFSLRGKRRSVARRARLVTLFLVNAQQEPGENKDSAWVFQPELIVRGAGKSDRAIFRRRVALASKDDDEERQALEMIYRKLRLLAELGTLRVDFCALVGSSTSSTTYPIGHRHDIAGDEGGSCEHPERHRTE
jgi:hypothetical protein